MGDSVFVDTNVLVYARDASEPEKQEKAATWMASLWRTKRGCLSYQVLQEFYVTVTRKLHPGLPVDRAREDVRSLLSWRPPATDASLLEGAWVVQDRFGLSWWDALIVAAAQAAGCRFLLTEDLQENQQFAAVEVVNPFRNDPALILE